MEESTRYKLELHGGSLESVSEETFRLFQESISSLIKESRSAGITISMPVGQDTGMASDIRMLSLGEVSGP